MPTNGSFVLESNPSFTVVRVAGPPPGHFWRVTFAGNCSYMAAEYMRGIIPEYANVVRVTGEAQSYAETTEADVPGSFQVTVRTPFQSKKVLTKLLNIDFIVFRSSRIHSMMQAQIASFSG